MSNLIITIISIALVAVAAIIGIFYGGAAFQSAQVAAQANAMIAQNQQIFAAAQTYSLNNGGSVNVIPMCALINGNYLSSWPDNIMLGPAPHNGSTTTTGSFDSQCYGIAGYSGSLQRLIETYNNSIYIIIRIFTTSPSCPPAVAYGSDNLASANDPMVLVAKAFNNSSAARVPAGATYASSGLPYLPGYPSTIPKVNATTSGACPTMTSGNYALLVDAGGNPITGYCGIGNDGSQTVPFITCQFSS